MGTGVVGFNLAKRQAVMCDANPHLVGFYSLINSREFNPEDIRSFLSYEGAKLNNSGAEYYYYIRERFILHKHPLDFLFINRSCFNGMIRFNKKGQINIPFCHKNDRFSKAYITKICNQIYNIKNVLSKIKVIFKFQDFKETIASASQEDIIYCDPPYIDRHTDYYNTWNKNNELELFQLLSATKAKFILSTWHHNNFRKNSYIDKYWHKFNIITREHLYHVGAREANRHSMVEALVTNFDVGKSAPGGSPTLHPVRPTLFP